MDAALDSSPAPRANASELAAVLPVLAQELRETRAEVASAVEHVASNFNGLATRARQSVDEAAALIGGDESGDACVDELITSSHQTLETLMQRIVRGGELSMQAVYRMDDVEVGMKRIAQILGDVTDVATRTRLLTVNAKIEAAHVGEQGRGFAVVAAEISQLSVKSADVVTSITEILNRLVADVSATVADLRELASADMSEVLLGKDRIEGAIRSFDERHRQLQQRLHSVTQSSEALAGDIAGAVDGLKFQTRVGERLAHVIEGLDAARGSLTPAPLPARSAAFAGDRTVS
jgi:methyl-accepting chemotaxis protein